MPIIRLETHINAPIGRVFDLARDIDAHIESTRGTAERAVAGRTSGLIGPGETVTWEARHFGITQRMTVRITEMDRPRHFVDEMMEGPFARMRHRHSYECDGDGTLMRDEFDFRAPLGALGRMAEVLFLTRYMKRLLEKRNAILKAMAEK